MSSSPFYMAAPSLFLLTPIWNFAHYAPLPTSKTGFKEEERAVEGSLLAAVKSRRNKQARKKLKL